MPFYEVIHSYPLEPSQRQTLAESITKLHAHTFTTPSFFVNVKFTQCDASDKSYFVAGVPKTTATNRIHANVRTSASRTKASFDKLAAEIEEAWYDAIDGEKQTEGKDEGKRPGAVDATDRDVQAKELLFVVFYPMIAVRERGMTISEAGKEKEFFEEYLPIIRKKGEEGDEEYQSIIDEFEKREDLQKLLGGSGSGALSGLMERVGLGAQVGGGKAGQQQGDGKQERQQEVNGEK